ncbi:hypothetical protein [Burkholderia territorii]|uniref:hypothetical protein n=1 Tax=Burkholderia territorii TaxID=1503055 RepID=UPI0018C8D434|nr:hypothetical protein [Burkholderia territorii]
MSSSIFNAAAGRDPPATVLLGSSHRRTETVSNGERPSGKRFGVSTRASRVARFRQHEHKRARCAASRVTTSNALYPVAGAHRRGIVSAEGGIDFGTAQSEFRHARAMLR